ncbi:MAG: phosphatase PAP2 family protein [Alistipes sp.]|nr:phosphatase PAP2 family protein [Rikenellaceae bacterium]MBQ2728670.1 phosphatase PAP2 family protein [Alistipes sp.]MBQ3082784.1 phosphatase PAP2 family protein [Alistipes sp.]
MYTFDHNLFLALNFDGGAWMDRLMLTISGTPMWIPLYLLIFYLVGRDYGWRRLLFFMVLLAASMGIADIVAGIFKHSGLLGDLLPALEPRWRPMFEPALEGYDISPDSLKTLRASGLLENTIVHVPMEAIGGRFGTVSAHASTVCALCALSVGVLRRRWFTLLMVVCTVLICYSRIYLAKHYPMDIFWGALLGIGLGWIGYLLFFRYFCGTNEKQ